MDAGSNPPIGSILYCEFIMKNGSYNLVVAPEDYPGKRYRDKYCFEHYLVWWENNDYVPMPDDDFVIHHIDGDTHNNNISNLVIMRERDHCRLHNNERQKRKMVLVRCPNCGYTFVKERRKTWLSKGGKLSFCSRRCSGQYSFPTRKLSDSDLSKERLLNIVAL